MQIGTALDLTIRTLYSMASVVLIGTYIFDNNFVMKLKLDLGIFLLYLVVYEFCPYHMFES